MALYNFHRVLISSAILFFFGFALWSFRLHQNTQRGADLAMAIVSIVLAVAMVGYLIYFNYRLRIIHQGSKKQ